MTDVHFLIMGVCIGSIATLLILAFVSQAFR